MIENIKIERINNEQAAIILDKNEDEKKFIFSYQLTATAIIKILESIGYNLSDGAKLFLIDCW